MNTIPTRGARHICASCATKFFDLNVTPAACPKCQTRVPAAKIVTPRKRRAVRGSTSEASHALPEARAIAAAPVQKKVKWK